MQCYLANTPARQIKPVVGFDYKASLASRGLRRENRHGWWTAERTQKLRHYWQAGHTSYEITVLLGACSRNAIMGKLNRLGIKLHGQEGN